MKPEHKIGGGAPRLNRYAIPARGFESRLTLSDPGDQVQRVLGGRAHRVSPRPGLTRSQGRVQRLPQYFEVLGQRPVFAVVASQLSQKRHRFFSSAGNHLAMASMQDRQGIPVVEARATTVCPRTQPDENRGYYADVLIGIKTFLAGLSHDSCLLGAGR